MFAIAAVIVADGDAGVMIVIVIVTAIGISLII